MTYKIKYDDDADVLTIVVKEKGKLSHAEEVGDLVLHVDTKGEPLFLEILRASKIVPLMVEGLAKKRSNGCPASNLCCAEALLHSDS